MKVLVTSARGPHALAIIRSLGFKGHEVTAGDSTRLSMGMYSRFAVQRLRYPSATEDPAGFVKALTAELEREKYGFLFPTFEETFLIARHRDHFARLAPHLVPPYEQMMQVHNKTSLADLCARHGIATPVTHAPKTEAELEELAKKLTYPVVIKLPEGNNSIGLQFAADEEELKKRYLKLVRFFQPPPECWPLVQEKIEGEILFTQFLADHGKVIGQLVYQPLHMFPEGGGTAFHREAIRHLAIEDLSQEFIAALGWHGFIGFDFIIERGSKKPYLIDANPRTTPAYQTGLEAGVDFTQMALDLARERKPKANLAPEAGVRSKILFVELLWYAFLLLPGKGYFRRVRTAWQHWRERDTSVGDVYRRDDLLPALILCVYAPYFMFIVNTLKKSRGGFMFGCNYDRVLADQAFAESAENADE